MDELDPVELALMPDELRAVCGQLIRGIVGNPTEIASLVSDDPMFLIRSASPTLFKEFIGRVCDTMPEQKLVIVSHDKDRDMVEKFVSNSYSFHPYPVQGPYSLTTFSRAFPEFETMTFGGKVLLDESGTLSEFEHVLDIVNWIQGGEAHAWSGIESKLFKLGSLKKRECAREALQALAKWNATRLE